MIDCKVLTVVSIFSIVGLFSLAFADVGYLQIPQTNENKIQSRELCNFITNELKFCIEKQKIVVTQPKSFTLNFSLTNVSKHEIDVNKYDGGNYIFRVTNEKDEVMITRLEQKMRKGEMSEDDKKTFVNSLVRNHQSITLQPEEIYNEKIMLGEIYDFTNVGKYYVEVVRKTKNPTERNIIKTSLKNIEIEVK